VPAATGHRRSRSEIGLFVVRYGIGVVMVIAGIVLLITVPGTGVEGFGMAVGGGLAVLLLNLLYRMGVAGDEDRAREEEARRYLDEHGVWPDDPPAAKARRWNLPAGVAPPEDDHPRAARRRS
jgi:hypothetical protein